MIDCRPGIVKILVEGPDLSQLQNERGGHQFQRVPPTERKGRVQTSTVTVAVLDPAVPQISVDSKDIRTEWFSGTGAGGQHRNKHQNSCRLIHIPTQISATAQTRSRESSYKEAYSALIKRIETEMQTSTNAAIVKLRREQVGRGMRGDRIRTYRMPMDLVKDHRTNKSASCEKVLNGFFEALW